MAVDGAEGVEERLSRREGRRRGDFRWFGCGVLVDEIVVLCVAKLETILSRICESRSRLR